MENGEFKALRVEGFQGFRVSGFQGFRVTGFQGFRVCRVAQYGLSALR